MFNYSAQQDHLPPRYYIYLPGNIGLKFHLRSKLTQREKKKNKLTTSRGNRPKKFSALHAFLILSNLWPISFLFEFIKSIKIGEKPNFIDSQRNTKFRITSDCLVHEFFITDYFLFELNLDVVLNIWWVVKFVFSYIFFLIAFCLFCLLSYLGTSPSQN